MSFFLFLGYITCPGPDIKCDFPLMIYCCSKPKYSKIYDRFGLPPDYSPYIIEWKTVLWTGVL